VTVQDRGRAYTEVLRAHCEGVRRDAELRASAQRNIRSVVRLECLQSAREWDLARFEWRWEHELEAGAAAAAGAAEGAWVPLTERTEPPQGAPMSVAAGAPPVVRRRALLADVKTHSAAVAAADDALVGWERRTQAVERALHAAGKKDFTSRTQTLATHTHLISLVLLSSLPPSHSFACRSHWTHLTHQLTTLSPSVTPTLDRRGGGEGVPWLQRRGAGGRQVDGASQPPVDRRPARLHHGAPVRRRAAPRRVARCRRPLCFRGGLSPCWWCLSDHAGRPLPGVATGAADGGTHLSL